MKLCPMNEEKKKSSQSGMPRRKAHDHSMLFWECMNALLLFDIYWFFLSLQDKSASLVSYINSQRTLVGKNTWMTNRNDIYQSPKSFYTPKLSMPNPLWMPWCLAPIQRARRLLFMGAGDTLWCLQTIENAFRAPKALLKWILSLEAPYYGP